MSRNPSSEPSSIGQIFNGMALHNPDSRGVFADAAPLDAARRNAATRVVARHAVEVAREDIGNLAVSRAEGQQLDPAEVAAARRLLLEATAEHQRVRQDTE